MEEQTSTVQDESRERQIRDLLSLKETGEGRMGADAVDESGIKFELKSGTKESITTARDVGLHTIEKWRTRHWIVAYGDNYRSGFQIKELYYLSPQMMEGWFRKIEIRLGPDLAIWKDAKGTLKSHGFKQDALERLEYLISRGVTLNNPKIPLAYIRAHGILLEKPYSKALRSAMLKATPSG